MSYVVRIGFDDGERRYFVEKSDIPGLNVEADSFEELVEIVRDVTPDLIGDDANSARVIFEREIALA